MRCHLNCEVAEGWGIDGWWKGYLDNGGISRLQAVEGKYGSCRFGLGFRDFLCGLVAYRAQLDRVLEITRHRGSRTLVDSVAGRRTGLRGIPIASRKPISLAMVVGLCFGLGFHSGTRTRECLPRTTVD